jgi:DNA-binding winged helix-turn-helix (wHTH) protein
MNLEQAWRFGPYVLWTLRRRLEHEGAEVVLGARCFDLLVHLVRNAGRVVGKEELLRAVWGGVVVGETCLRVHLSALRKALAAPHAGGERWIVNVPQRSYVFCGAALPLGAVEAQRWRGPRSVPGSGP